MTLWRRLETPGHDACRLLEQEDGWRLQGAAVFIHPSGPASLTYALDCDREWKTRKGVVNGWVGDHSVDLEMARTASGVWIRNGQMESNMEECVDLDLGFTPATNLSQLRRIALKVGEGADVPVVWLDVPFGSLEVLQQRYERREADTYWYESPRFNYSALLRVNAAGFVESYPGLWEVESTGWS